MKNGEYLIFYKDELIQDLSFYIRKKNKEKIKNLSDEEQIEIFNKEKDRQRNLAYELLNILDTLDKNIVMEVLKEYEYIK